MVAFDLHGVQPLHEIDKVRGCPHVVSPLHRTLTGGSGIKVMLLVFNVERIEILGTLITLMAFSRGI